MEQDGDPRCNSILGKLGPDEFRRLRPHLDRMELRTGRIVLETGARVGTVFFPESGLISRVMVSREGSSTAVAITGREGIVGIAPFFGSMENSFNRAVVQCPGHTWRIPAEAALREFRRNGSFQSLVLRYSLALLTQVSQTVLCNRFHAVEARFCRWLLLSADLLGGNDLNITQELISDMLGVRRETITLVVSELHKQGLLDARRRHLHLADAAGLEQRACECYSTMKKEHERLVAVRSPL